MAAVVAATGGWTRKYEGAGKLAIAGGELVIRSGEGERRIPLGDVEQGYVEDALVPWDQSALASDEPDALDSFKNEQRGIEVLLRTKSGEELAARVADRAQGEAVLEAAGVSVTARVARTPLTSAATGSSCGEMAGLLALLCIAPFVL